MVDNDQRHPLANALNAVDAEQAKSMGIANIMTISNGAIVPGKKVL